MITYRKALEDDLINILNIIQDNPLGKERENVKNIDLYLNSFREINNSADNFLIVMLLNDVIIGTFQLTITPYLVLQGKKRGTIESFHVDSSLRGKGYGAKMMQYAIQMAKKKGVKIVQLTTNKKRDAKGFYEKLGFIASHEGLKLDIS